MGGALSRDDSLRPRLWPAKQRFPSRVSRHQRHFGKSTSGNGPSDKTPGIGLNEFGSKLG